MSKRGRPTKLTSELSAQVLSFLRSGAYVETAAAAAGVSKQSLYDWLRRGAQERQGIHRDFLDAVEKAQATAEIRDVTLIAKAAETFWQAAAWRLERKFPAKWGQRVQHTVREELSAALTALKEGLGQDEYAKVVQILSDAGQAGEH